MALPIKIDPCPIAEAGFEVRFTASIYAGAVFGLVYNVLKESHPSTVVKLPILQLPEELRDQDPNLIYRPHYQISNDNFFVQIGPRVIVIVCKTPYPGWKAFKQEVVDALAAIIDTEAIGTIERMGLRYVNIFTGDVTEEITLKIKSEVPYDTKTVSMRMTVEHGGLMNNINIHNEALVGEKKDQAGTVVDIDTFINLNMPVSEWGYADILDRMHDAEKSIFFASLEQSLLERLNPTY